MKLKKEILYIALCILDSTKIEIKNVGDCFKDSHTVQKNSRGSECQLGSEEANA